jgi:hypothetical protein
VKDSTGLSGAEAMDAKPLEIHRVAWGIKNHLPIMSTGDSGDNREHN